jgi:hypothetical protein
MDESSDANMLSRAIADVARLLLEHMADEPERRQAFLLDVMALCVAYAGGSRVRKRPDMDGSQGCPGLSKSIVEAPSSDLSGAVKPACRYDGPRRT